MAAPFLGAATLLQNMTLTVGFVQMAGDDEIGRGRAERLDVLKALLANRDVTTVEDLATDLGGGRTVQRDLATLRRSGCRSRGTAAAVAASGSSAAGR